MNALRSEQDAVVGRLCGSSFVTGGAKFPGELSKRQGVLFDWSGLLSSKRSDGL